MLVFIKNKDGNPLMPCSPRRARLLLKEDKARIIGRKPFVIQLVYGSSGYTQETRLGVDTGSKFIGVAITSQDRVLIKGQIELRQDIKKNLENRKNLRKARRGRKTRYRKARFLNRKKVKGWLPPSIQSRIYNTIRWINKFYYLLPNCKLSIEVGKFDIQKIENPNISGIEYQQGNLYQYRNRIAYLIAREKDKCQYCGKEYIKEDPWRLHHIWGKEKDRSQDWALIHESCHREIHQQKKEGVLRKKKSRSFKESTFMNIIRRRLFTVFPDANFTYGSITFQDRCNLNLDKTHYNDAIAIAGVKQISNSPNSLFAITQSRKKKRSLHESIPRGGRKSPNNTAKRNSKNTKAYKGFCLNDKVKVFDQTGFITGFTTECCYVKNIMGTYITRSEKHYKQILCTKIRFIEHNNNWQFIPNLKERDFLPNEG